MLSIESSKQTQINERELRHSRINWEKGIKKGSILAGESIVKRTRTLLNTGVRTGRKYKRLPNRSSAPGEMPRSQSGRLARGIYATGASPHVFRVGSSAEYSHALAKGNPENNLKPRRNKDEDWLLYVINLEQGITEKYLEMGVMEEIR